LFPFFRQFGEVTKVTRATEKETGKRKRFAFVEFGDYDQVDKAIIHVSHEFVFFVCGGWVGVRADLEHFGECPEGSFLTCIDANSYLCCV
jgi:hypothetical protein